MVKAWKIHGAPVCPLHLHCEGSNLAHLMEFEKLNIAPRLLLPPTKYRQARNGSRRRKEEESTGGKQHERRRNKGKGELA